MMDLYVPAGFGQCGQSESKQIEINNGSSVISYFYSRNIYTIPCVFHHFVPSYFFYRE